MLLIIGDGVLTKVGKVGATCVMPVISGDGVLTEVGATGVTGVVA
jgi:hypothetical protein